MNYIDTSVIVAALDPLNQRQKSAKEILEKEDKVISELVLAELASILNRKETLSELIVKLGLRKELSYHNTPIPN
jgi:predicted nucleic acid-binding protein